jgi:hypothetical protein
MLAMGLLHTSRRISDNVTHGANGARPALIR